jgi:hypothetical protein
MTIVEMLPFIAPRSGASPRLNDEVVGFVKVFPVIGRVSVVEKLFAASAADPAGNETPTRNQIDFGEFLGHP